MIRKIREERIYRWIVIGASFLMVMISLGFCSSSKSLYLAAVTEATGIPRSLFSISDTFRYVTTSIINLFFGALILRFGTKKLMAAGFVSLIAFALIFSRATQAWHFYIGGMFLGMGMSWTTTTMVGHIVNVWCKEYRGTVMGAVLGANGIGAAIATQVVSPMINDPVDQFGYRKAYLVTAVLLAITAVIMILVYRDRKDAGSIAPTKGKKRKGNTWPGFGLKEAIHTPYFYIAGFCVLITGFALQAIASIAAAHMKDVGMDATFVAAVISAYSIMLALAKVFVGWLYDRVGLKKTLLFSDIMALSAIFLLILIKPTSSGRTMAYIYGVCAALGMPLETIMIPLIVADLFGEHSYEKMLGIFVSINTAGFALSSPLINLCYDLMGTYIPALEILCGIMILVTILSVIFLRAAAIKRERLSRINSSGEVATKSI